MSSTGKGSLLFDDKEEFAPIAICTSGKGSSAGSLCSSFDHGLCNLALALLHEVFEKSFVIFAKPSDTPSTRLLPILQTMSQPYFDTNEVDNVATLVERHGNVGGRVWCRIQYVREDLAPLQRRLAFELSSLTAFNMSLQTESLSRIETCIQKIVFNARRGTSPFTILSAHEEGNAEGWMKLRRELASEVPISPKDTRDLLGLRLLP